MKSMRSHKKRIKLTLAERVEREYENLPKWAKSAIVKEAGDREISITNMMHTINVGLNVDKDTGQVYSIRQIFINQASQIRQSDNKYGTKRYLFREFRTKEHAIYNRLNSYFYRHNKSSLATYFYNNVKLKGVNSYTIIAHLALPEFKDNNPRRKFRIYFTGLRLVYTFHSYNEGDFDEAILEI